MNKHYQFRTDPEGNIIFFCDAEDTLDENEPGISPGPGDDEIIYIEQQASTAVPADEKGRNVLSRNEILGLIAAYKKNINMMKTKGITKKKVWTVIAHEVHTHSAIQCSNKFKYLKGQYIRKKENMEPNGTEEKPVKFDYLDEFKELFGKDPTIKPPIVASNKKGAGNLSPETVTTITADIVTPENPTEVESTPKRKRATEVESTPKRKIGTPAGKKNIVKALEDYNGNVKEKEENKKRRHEENIQLKKEALHAFKTYMQQLLNK